METNEIAPPSKYLKSIRGFRFASIYFNFSLTCLILCVLATFSSFIIPVFYGFVMIFAALALLLLFLLVIITFGLILLVPNNPIQKMLEFMSGSNTEKIIEISQKCFSLVPYLCYIGLGCCLIAIVSMAVNKQRSVPKIVFTSIFAGIMIISLIFYYVMGGVIWQS